MAKLGTDARMPGFARVQPVIAEESGRIGLGRPETLARPGTITRDRLVSRLLRARESNCVLVLAPGGYGKTTLLGEWAGAEERDVGWVTLDRRHDDPTLLIAAIVAAITPTIRIDETVLAPFASPRPDVSGVVVPRLCAELAGAPEVALVLDDADAVRSADGHAVLASLARHLPANVQLIIAARREPQMRLGRLRTERSITEIGTEDLAMTRSEASRLLRACGQTVGRDTVGRLVERTEGWPAGLYLAALWLQGESDAEGASAQFTGDDRLVADYLREELLGRLPEQTLEFLISASVLDRLSGDSCDAVLEREGSAELLRRLAHENLFVVPLDRRDHEYRFHQLLREALQAELHRRGERRERALHSRASHWYAERADADRAVDHAISAGDVEAMGELAWEAMPAYSGLGRHATLAGWMSAFPEKTMLGSARLCICAAVVALVDCDSGQTERWVQAADRARTSAGSGDDSELSAGIAMLGALSGTQQGVMRTAEELAAIFDQLPVHSSWRSLCCLCEGVMRRLGGDRELGGKKLTEAVRIGITAAPSPASVALAELALAALDEEDVEQAWAHAHRALASVEHYGLQDYPTSTLVFAVAALVCARRGDSARARSHAERAGELLAVGIDPIPWLEVQTRTALARTSILLDELTVAREQISAARRRASLYFDAVHLDSWLKAAEQAVEIAGADSARWPLTPAEVRLLQYLPTHRSFPEVAAELFVSTNTVKTQAQSIYRKFNVSSRAEAVECASLAGLLGDRSPVQEDAAADQGL